MRRAFAIASRTPLTTDIVQKAGGASIVSCRSINRPAGGDRPDLLDAVGADADIPVVEVDGRVAVAGDQPDLVAEREAVGGGRDGACRARRRSARRWRRARRRRAAGPQWKRAPWGRRPPSPRARAGR